MSSSLCLAHVGQLLLCDLIGLNVYAHTYIMYIHIFIHKCIYMYTQIHTVLDFLWSLSPLFSRETASLSCMLNFFKLSVALYLCMADRCHRFGAIHITLALCRI